MKKRQKLTQTGASPEHSFRKDRAEKYDTREILDIRAISPTTVSCEIPILTVLNTSPEKGLAALAVVREVSSSNWFPKLTDEDRNARYPHSLRKIVSTTARWSRENLVLKGELHLPGDDCDPGVWKATSKGRARAKEHRGKWIPRYTTHDANYPRSCWQG
jgi:hypothetical protein